MSVRLYGRDVGNGSLAVVTRGFRDVLQDAGLLEGLVALDKQGGSEEDEPPDGALARDAVFTGNLNGTGVMTRGTRHERHWVQVTPNSTFVPKELLGLILKLPNPTILSCSDWGKHVILTALREMLHPVVIHTDSRGATVRRLEGDEFSVDILTVRHGITGFAPSLEDIEKSRVDYRSEQFRVVHFSTTEGERKGTLELVQAWTIAQRDLPSHAQLYLVLDYHARAALQQRLVFEEVALPPNVMLVPRADLDAERMAKFLCHMHVVAAPSRGEGFGLLPLQARACGVPCIATVTTGHSAGHVTGGGVRAILQPPELLPIDDGPAALAQALLPEDIASCLIEVYHDWPQMSQHALEESPAVIEKWSWHKQLAPLVEALR